MTEYRPNRAIRVLQYAAVSVVMVLAIAGLVGWAGGALQLAGKIFNYDAMVPISALTFLVLSTALLLRVDFAVRSRLLVDGMLAAVLAVATLEVIDLFTGLPLAPDRLFASAAEMSVARSAGCLLWWR